MTKFKVGDKVVRRRNFCPPPEKGQQEGGVYIVSSIEEGRTVRWMALEGIVIANNEWPFDPDNYKLATTQRHKHYKMIMAWAEGEIIEFTYSDSHHTWVEMDPGLSIGWYSSYRYRVKPKKTQQQTEIEKIEKEMRELADRVKDLKSET